MTGVFGNRRATSICAAAACALCIVMFAAPRRAAACPVEPSLGEYVEMADAIFVGKIRAAVPRTEKGEDGEPQTFRIAAYEIETVLKGRLDTEKLLPLSNVRVEVDGASPGAALEDDGSRYLVFASSEEGDSQLLTSRQLQSDAEAGVFADRVREMLDILATADDAERERRRAEWAVRCAESTVTRRDGVAELYRLDRASGEEDETAAEDPLDSSQRERLVSTLLAARDEEIDASLALGNYLSRYRDARVLDYFVSWLAGAPEERAGEAQWAMYTIAEQLDWQTGRWLAERFPSDGNRKARAAATARYLELMRTREELPEALAAAEPEQSEAEAEAVYEREYVIREAEQRYEFDPEQEDLTTENTENMEDPTEEP